MVPGRTDSWSPVYPAVMAPSLTGVCYVAQNPCDRFFQKKRPFFLEIRHCFFHHIIFRKERFNSVVCRRCARCWSALFHRLKAEVATPTFARLFGGGDGCKCFEPTFAPQSTLESAAVFGNGNILPHFVCICHHQELSDVCIYLCRLSDVCGVNLPAVLEDDQLVHSSCR